tara:strand:- start:4817 stop:5368 length:552 start_codon:yes stop_codon:yes gene_type:complete
MLTNSATRYGMVSIILHWLVAVAIFSLFALGYWMVDLTYYSSWYRSAPYWHKSIGIMLFFLVIFRLFWRFSTQKPRALSSHSVLEKRLARITHIVLYLLLLLIMLSGYLISTADGRPIAVFDWFNVPALGELFPRQADIAGAIHQYLAYGLVGLSAFHALGALKHHFIDKDSTLRRMFGHSAQ